MLPKDMTTNMCGLEMPQYLSESVTVKRRLPYAEKETSRKLDPNLSSNRQTHNGINIYSFYCYIFYVFSCCVTFTYKTVHAMKRFTILFNLILLTIKFKSILNTIFIKLNPLMKCYLKLYTILNFNRLYIITSNSGLYLGFNFILLIYFTRYKCTVRIIWIPQHTKFCIRTRGLYRFIATHFDNG